MAHKDKVEAELGRYEHPLLHFSCEESAQGLVLRIDVKDGPPGLHTYRAPLHPRDLESTQFPWTFQRYLYDCLHDYLVEMFTRTPQSRDA